MKQVLIESYGTPWEVARCAEVPDVGAPAADEVVFDVLAFPINPADMWLLPRQLSAEAAAARDARRRMRRPRHRRGRAASSTSSRATS